MIKMTMMRVDTVQQLITNQNKKKQQNRPVYTRKMAFRGEFFFFDFSFDVFKTVFC